MAGMSQSPGQALDSPEPRKVSHIVNSNDEDEEGAIVLDANNSERQYYYDTFSKMQREVWRPGAYPVNNVVHTHIS